MAAQLLTLLGNMVRGSALALPRAARSFAAAGRALRRPPGQPAQFNLSQLARQLGTVNPSPAQIAAHQQQINQQNQQFAMSTRLGNAAGHAGGGIAELGKFSAALTVAQRGLTSLADIVNRNAVESLKVYSATMAAEAAKQGRFAMQYNQERARLVSGSTTALGASLRQSAKEWQPYAAGFENLKNDIFKFVVDLGGKAAVWLEKLGITDAVRRWNNEHNKKMKDGQAAINSILRDLGAGRHAGPLNGRPNERPGSRM